MPSAIPISVQCPSLRGVSLEKFLGIVSLLLIASLSFARATQSVTLAWDASPGSDVAGYKLYYGTDSGSSSQIVNVGTATIALVTNLNKATKYFFSVIAYNAAGLESVRSNEVSITTLSDVFSLTVIDGSGDGSYTAG